MSQNSDSATDVSDAVPEVRRLKELRGTLSFHAGATGALVTIVALCTGVVPLQLFVLRFMPAYWAALPMALSRLIARLVGVETQVRGTHVDGPVLFVSNHISWLDIPVIGGHAKGAFIAKREVAGWGGISLMARLYRSVFVDRGRRRASLDQRDEISSRLEDGDSLILFAEGTSTDGTMVKPFKSALFAVADHHPGLVIQPVTISYTHINGMPISRSMRPLIGWFGDMELTSHIWQVLRLGKIRAVIQFHEPVTAELHHHRKDLAALCHERVAKGLAAANSGRLD